MKSWSAAVAAQPHRLGGAAANAAEPGQSDALLKAGRMLVYPGLALTSLLLLRGPAELPIGDILIALGGVLAAMSLARHPHRLPGALVVAAVLVGAGALLAATVSSDPAESLGIGARVVFCVAVVPWILLTVLVEDRHVVAAVAWWLAGAAACAAFALLNALFGEVIPGAMVTGDARFSGFTPHVSDLGGITAMGVGAGLGAVFSSLPRRSRALLVALGAVCATGLLLSGSVSGMLAATAALIYLMLAGVVRLGRALPLLVIGATAGGFALSLLSDVGARGPIERFLLVTGQTTAGADANTADIRLDLATRAVAGILGSPLVGHGLPVEDNTLRGTFTVHNIFLAAWHSGGILFLAGVLVATVFAVRWCLAGRAVHDLGTVVAAAVIAAVVFAQTAPSFYNRYYWLPVAFAVVLAVRSRRHARVGYRRAHAVGPDLLEVGQCSRR